jgi:CheY-like chemotaxis protein
MDREESGPRVLFIEDTQDDRILLRAAFQHAKVPVPLQVCYSAEEAIDYLEGKGSYADRTQYPLPTLILVDLKLDGMGGLEFIAYMRKHPDPALRNLRMVVLSGSEFDRDIQAAYQLGANSYLAKPADLDDLVEMAQALSVYWFSWDGGKSGACLQSALPSSEPSARPWSPCH